MKRIKPWLLIALAALAVVIVLLVGTLQYFGTPAGSARLLSWAQGKLERDFGTHLEFSEGRFSLFSGFHFKNLHVVKEDENSRMEFKAEALDIDYSWSLLKRELDIQKLSLVRSSLALRSHGPSTPEGKTEGPSGMERLAEWIQSPPVRLRIHDLAIEDLDIDFDSRDEKMSAQAKIQDFFLHLRLEMEKEKLALSGDLKSDRENQIAFKSSAPDASSSVSSLEASLRAAVSGKWAIGIHRESGEWKYSFNPSDLKMSLRDLKATQVSAGTTNRIQMPRAEMNGGAEIRARGQNLFIADGAHSGAQGGARENSSLESANAKFEARTGPLIVDQEKGAAKLRLTIDQQKLSLQSQLTQDARAQDAQVDLDYQAQKINSPTYFLKPADFAWKTKATIAKNLSEIQLKSQAFLNAIELLQFDGAVTNDTSKTIRGALTIAADPSLASILKPAAALKSSGPLRANANIDATMHATGATDFKLAADIPKILHPSLKTAASLAVKADGKWNSSPNHLDLNGDLTFASAQFGKWNVKTRSEFTLPGSEPGEGSTSSRGPLGKGRTQVTEIERPKPPHALPASVNGTMVFAHRFDMTPGRQDFHLEGDIPSMALVELGVVSGTQLVVQAKSPDLAGAKDLDFSFDLKQKDLAFDQKAAKDLAMGLPKLSGLSAKIKGTLRRGREFAIDSLSAGFSQPAIQLSAQATGDVQTKNLLGQGELSVRLPEHFSPAPGQEIKGQISLPLSLSVLQGKELALNGHVDLKKVDWKKEGVAAQGISGRIPFTEKLKWNGESFSFTHLIVQNPFERVDFERVRPLLEGAEQVRIEKIHWEERSFGPLIGFFSLRQNMIFAHQFDMDIGRGRAYGQMYFDAYPRNMQVGVLSRLTGLDLGEILPKKFLARAPSGGKTVSGRTGFTLNLNRSAMDGRLDVTEIGGPQLIAMINVLDPMYEDEKMNNVRSLLQVGYPTAVELAFADGYMNMEIALTVLGVSQRQSVRGIPISSLLSSATADILKKTEKGPLK